MSWRWLEVIMGIVYNISCIPLLLQACCFPAARTLN